MDRSAIATRIEGLSDRVRADQLNMKILAAMLEADNNNQSIEPFLETKFGAVFVTIGNIPLGRFSDTSRGVEEAEKLLEIAIKTTKGW